MRAVHNQYPLATHGRTLQLPLSVTFVLRTSVVGSLAQLSRPRATVPETEGAARVLASLGGAPPEFWQHARRRCRRISFPTRCSVPPCRRAVGLHYKCAAAATRTRSTTSLLGEGPEIAPQVATERLASSLTINCCWNFRSSGNRCPSCVDNAHDIHDNDADEERFPVVRRINCGGLTMVWQTQFAVEQLLHCTGDRTDELTQARTFARWGRVLREQRQVV